MQRTIIFLLVVVLLVGCSNGTAALPISTFEITETQPVKISSTATPAPTKTLTKTPTPTAQKESTTTPEITNGTLVSNDEYSPTPGTREYQFNQWLDKPGQSSYAYNLRLSHNGKWFVVEVVPTYSIASLSFLFTIFQFDELAPVEDIYYDFDWSPNQAFLYAPKLYTPEKGCARDQFYILEETDGRLQVKSAHNTAIKTHSECMTMSWLWDGSEFALFTVPYGDKKIFDIQVFNMDAQLVQSYQYTLSEEDIASFPEGHVMQIYPEHGVVFISLYSDDESAGYSKIIALYENEPDKPRCLGDLQGNYKISTTDKDNERLVLVDSGSNQDNYVIYNISTGKVEKKGALLSDKYDDRYYSIGYASVTSLDKRFTTIRSGILGESRERSLLIWDWEAGDFKEYGNIDSVIGWDEERKAFLVLARADDGSYFQMKWIKPD